MSDLRMPDLNRVLIAGRLTRDPDLRYTTSNRPYCRLGLANTRYYKDRNGERREDTTFVDVAVWGPQAEWAGDRLSKGRPVLVEGSLSSNQWEDRQTGQKRSKVEVKALRVTPLDWEDDRGGSGGGGGGGGRGASRPQPAGADSQGSAGTEAEHVDEPVPEDDIPF